MTGQRPSEWFERVAEILSEITERWALAGALAALRYRRVERGTTDVDFLVEWHPGLTLAMERAGYQVRESTDPLLEHPHLLRCRRDDEYVDLIISTVPYQELAIDRATDHFLTVEDVIIHKLIAWRPRDQEDVASILAAGHELDREYIDHWAREWEVEDRWRDATSAR
jgi:hypothetical protein